MPPKMAVTMGFEPMKRISTLNRLAGGPIRPTLVRHLAGTAGVEPTTSESKSDVLPITPYPMAGVYGLEP